MPSNITINMTGDNADAIRAFQGVLAKERELDDATRKLGQENAKSAAAFKKLEDAAKRVWEQTRTPLERYNAEVGKLDRLMKTTTITQDTYNRRVAQLKSEYHEAASAGQKVFGAGPLAELGSMAAGFLSLATAIGFVKSGLDAVAQAKADAAGSARASRLGLGSLAGVAETPEETESLIQQAKDLYRKGGAASESEGADVIYAMKSSDQMEFVDLFRELRASGLVKDTGAMATAAGTIVSSMGKPETGDIRAVISKGLAASLPGVGSPEALMEAAARSGGKAKSLKLHDEEILAATAIASKSTGSPERAGTYLESLLTSFVEKGEEYKDLTLKQMIQKLKDKGLSGAELQTYLGRQEAFAAYSSLEGNLGQYDKALGDIDAAQKGDYVGKKLTFMNKVPSLVAARKADEAKAAEELSRESMGTIDNIAQAMILRQATQRRERGGNELLTQGLMIHDRFQRWGGGDESFFRDMRQREQRGYAAPMPDLWAQLEAAQKQQREAAEAMNAAATQLTGAAAELRGGAAESRDAARERGNPMNNHGDAR